MPDSAPTGIVTLMFTDIQDSTALWEKLGDRFRPVLDRHNEIVRERVRQWDGYEVKTQGDSFMVAFARGTDAVQCALEIQRAMAAEAWPEEVVELRARIGLHAGEPFLGYDTGGRADYFGPMVNRAARVADAGHGGQIVTTAATRDIVQGALTADVQLVDLGRHRLRGLEQAEQLFEVRHGDLPVRRFPPLRTLDTLRTNLPTHLTAFVGRKRELADLRETLSRPDTRLLTITGTSGSGKSRLAQEVAADCAGSFTDGVWLVPLADVSDAGSVVPQIAAAVQLALLPAREPLEQLITFLSERELLLVLDSFERVLGASLVIGEILKAAPLVKCLVSSQIALRLTGEREYRIPPLQAPGEETTAPEQLIRFDSVTLFFERARAVRADFALTEANAPAIGEICRKLDGVPLAIELAAAQVVEMSVVEVLEGLSSRLDLLWSESPDLPERHRTLRAAIDWSYGLLSPPEQTALQQFSIFAGGCYRESAQAVCGTAGLAALRTLLRHSLLNTTETLNGRTRYKLLETVRQYAREKLEEDAAAAREVGERHARHFLAFAEPRIARMRTRDEVQALEELGEETDNLRAAIDWALREGQNDLAARLALALYEPLHRRGFWEEAHRRLREVWSATDSLPEARELRAAIGYSLASLDQDMGELLEARSQAEAILALRRELNNPAGIADALNMLGYLGIHAGEMEAAHQSLEAALPLLTDADHAIRGRVLHNLGFLASRRGDADEARRLYEESLGHLRAAGDLRDEAVLLGDLGALAYGTGEFTEARRLYLESLTHRRALQDRQGIAVMLHNLGEVAETEGDLETAAALQVHAERIFRELHSPFVTEPARYLQRLAEKIGPERWAQVRAAAERTRWEEVVERGEV